MALVENIFFIENHRGPPKQGRSIFQNLWSIWNGRRASWEPIDLNNLSCSAVVWDPWPVMALFVNTPPQGASHACQGTLDKRGFKGFKSYPARSLTSKNSPKSYASKKKDISDCITCLHKKHQATAATTPQASTTSPGIPFITTSHITIRFKTSFYHSDHL